MIQSTVSLLVSAISVLACVTALIYVGNIMNKLFGGFRKSYGYIRLGLLCILITVLSLTIVGPLVGAPYDFINGLTINIFIALASLLIALGVKKSDKIIELLPNTIVDKINDRF